jgi:DNA-binding MarR family transcriptional regulator
MEPTQLPTPLRDERVEHIVRDLVPHASQLTRLVFRHVRGEISRTEGGMLRTLSAGPRRITELAELEGLAQPTTTILIKRLEENDWVSRERDPEDGRVVLVSLTPAGAAALNRYREQYRATMRDRLAAMSDDQIAALDEAIDALDALMATFQTGDVR